MYLGVVTMRYDQDENGEYVGIKKGNCELPTAKRMSMQLQNQQDLNMSMPDLRAQTRASVPDFDKYLNVKESKKQGKGGCCS